MKVLRIVANVSAVDPARAEEFYGNILGLELLMDMNWIRTYGSKTKMSVQVSFMSEGGSETSVPELSIEVDDLDTAFDKFKKSGFEIEYGPVVEPWGVRRFFVRDPFGRLVNVLSHVDDSRPGSPHVARHAMDIVVRRAEGGDIGRMAVLSAGVQALHVDGRPDHFRRTSADELVQHLEQLADDDSSRVWVAERTGSLVAFAVVRVRETVPGPYLNARVWWELDQICVDPAQRNTGVGRALLERIRAEARAAAISSLELTCWDFNHDALLAFSKLGFRPKFVRLELPVPE